MAHMRHAMPQATLKEKHIEHVKLNVVCLLRWTKTLVLKI